MNKLKLTVFVTITLTILAIAATFLVPVPPQTTYFTFHLYFALACASSVLFIGSSLLFLLGFGGFKSRLRNAYILICIGFTLLGLAMLELPALLSVGLLESVVREKGYIVAVPFVASIVILLIGTVKLARLFSVKGYLVSWWFQPLMIIGISGLMFFSPHAETRVADTEFRASMAVAMSCAVILALNLAHVLAARSRAGVTYINALAWLAVSLVPMILVALGGVVSRVFFGDDSDYSVTALTLIPLFPAGLFLLYTGYRFNKITDQTPVGELVPRNFFGAPVTKTSMKVSSSVDIVLFTAQLASSLEAVDPIMDRLREVTSGFVAGQKLSPQDNDDIMKVYLQLEKYLVNEDPVRKFTQDGLRQFVTAVLEQSKSTEETFWPKLMPSTKPAPAADKTPEGSLAAV